MTIVSMLTPANLLIWLPACVFFVTSLIILARLKTGTPGKKLLLASGGLFLYSLIVLFVVPGVEMGKAIDFANDYADYEGAEITGYSDIPYDVGYAWKQTARPEDERDAMQGGGDMFSFDGAADEGSGEAASDSSGSGSGASAAVYKPSREVAWALMIFFLLPGMILLGSSSGKLLQTFSR